MKLQAGFFIAILSGAFLQVALFPAVKVCGVGPDILTVLMVASALTFESGWGLFFCALAGIAKDVFAITAGGANTMLFTAWAMVLAMLSRKISFEHRMVKLAAVCVVVLVNDLLVRPIFFRSTAVIPFGIYFRTSLLEVAYTLVLAPVIFYGNDWLIRKSAGSSADQEEELA